MIAITKKADRYDKIYKLIYDLIKDSRYYSAPYDEKDHLAIFEVAEVLDLKHLYREGY